MGEHSEAIGGVYAFNSDKDWKERGFYMRSPPMIFLCFDPAGDGDDHDALVVLSREEHQRGEPLDPDFAVEMKFRVMMCERLPPDYEYPDKMAKILKLHRGLVDWTAHGRITAHAICIESNGVGWGMTSDLRTKIGQFVIPYTTASSSGDKPYAGGKVTMPRLAALDHMRILMETHHFKITKEAPGASLLAAELNSFVWRRPGRPEAMEGQKDDLVMAACGGLWIGTKVVGPILKAETPKGGRVQ